MQTTALTANYIEANTSRYSIIANRGRFISFIIRDIEQSHLSKELKSEILFILEVVNEYVKQNYISEYISEDIVTSLISQRDDGIMNLDDIKEKVIDLLGKLYSVAKKKSIIDPVSQYRLADADIEFEEYIKCGVIDDLEELFKQGALFLRTTWLPDNIFLRTYTNKARSLNKLPTGLRPGY